jgi:hypothetical protein
MKINQELFDKYYIYEDMLPPMTEEQYRIWYDASWVDGVRIGPRMMFIFNTENDTRRKITYSEYGVDDE